MFCETFWNWLLSTIHMEWSLYINPKGQDSGDWVWLTRGGWRECLEHGSSLPAPVPCPVYLFFWLLIPNTPVILWVSGFRWVLWAALENEWNPRKGSQEPLIYSQLVQRYRIQPGLGIGILNWKGHWNLLQFVASWSEAQVSTGVWGGEWSVGTALYLWNLLRSPGRLSWLLGHSTGTQELLVDMGRHPHTDVHTHIQTGSRNPLQDV